MAIEEKEVKVVGMHCNSCVNAVQLSLTDVDGIEDAKADLDTGITKIKLDTDKVSDDDIKEAGVITYVKHRLVRWYIFFSNDGKLCAGKTQYRAESPFDNGKTCRVNFLRIFWV